MHEDDRTVGVLLFWTLTTFKPDHNRNKAHGDVCKWLRGGMCRRRCGRWSSTPSSRGVPRPRSRVGLRSRSGVGEIVPVRQHLQLI